MAKLPSIKISVINKASVNTDYIVFKSEVSVGSDGIFSCSFPEYLLDYVHGATKQTRVEVKVNKVNMVVRSSNLEDNKRALHKALLKFTEPDITEEIVILYNIQTHISFIENADGIYPDGYAPGAEYFNDDENIRGKWNRGVFYGEHHAANPSKGGYSIIVGAKVAKRITNRFQDQSKVYFENYSHGDGSPSHKLNSWSSFTLDSCKEIPYSDEAANFFNDMLMNMAKLAKALNDNFSTEDRLLRNVEQYKKTQKLLGFS